MSPKLLKILKYGLLPLVLGSGLFWIGLTSYHDWGGDFAQYLQEASNIYQGKPLAYSHYVFNPAFTRLGPKVYPPVFPAILALGKVFSTDSIVAGKLIETLFLVLSGWISFLLFLRHKIPYGLSLLLAFLFWYHPWMLDAKDQVLSDIPFAFFLVLTLYLLSFSQMLKWYIPAAMVAALAIGTRSIGWVLPLAAFLLFTRDLAVQKKASKPLLVFAVTTIILALLINWGSGYYSGSDQGYLTFFHLDDALNFIPHNLHESTYFIQNFADPADIRWRFFSLVIKAFLIVAFILGLAKIKWKTAGFPEILLLLYLMVLVVFPFSAGFRFLLPVFPLILIIAWRGFSHPGKLRYWYIFSIIFILLFIPEGIGYHIQQTTVEGPQTPEARQMLSAIKKQVPSGHVILFCKPRVLAYYTQKFSAGTRYDLNRQEFQRQAENLKADYFLSYSDIDYPALDQFIKNNKDRLSPIFSNSKFALYRLIKAGSAN